MHVYGSRAVKLSPGPASARRPPGTGFALAAEQSPSVGASGAMRAVSGIDTLLTLQGVEEPGEKRKRAARQGRRVLDALDELKIGLLSGTLDPTTLRRLDSTAREMSAETGDPRLDEILAEIDLRAEVELAKAGMR